MKLSFCHFVTGPIEYVSITYIRANTHTMKLEAYVTCTYVIKTDFYHFYLDVIFTIMSYISFFHSFSFFSGIFHSILNFIDISVLL